MTVCANCDHRNEPGARFCSQCGTPLAPPQPGRTERKVLTFLFADLVGFTARAEQLDPEDVQAVLAPYHARLRSELERYGGTVEKFIGDAVMALFGAPVAHEDDPERAVRAALAIRDWIAEEGKLEVRIGVNTGEALVNLAARPESGEGMAAGDIVNTAARIQAAAPANGILVGETTYRATAHTIDYGESSAIDAKGKEEQVPVWMALQARSRLGVDVVARPATPLVGRQRELEVLKGALARTRQQRSPELVTLIGVPGIGKSRLVAELFASIEDDSELIYWRQGRSLPYGEGISYWALAEMVKAQAGILETDDAGEADAKLERELARLIDEDLEWVRTHLRTLIGYASDSDAERDEAFAAWRRFFEAMAERGPLVLVFEDMHWADDGLLDFVEHLVDWVQGVPMLVLCTARLELLERRPSWGGGKLNAATLALAPLTEEETARLISQLSDRPLLAAETQRLLLARAGGNPLYAEQYVRMLAERETAEDLPLPESVQGIIAARLDALPSAEKALLQAAAVIGKVFWIGGLADGDDRSELERRLHALERKDFVQRSRRASLAGETEFSFKHGLVRDVAYGQIPRAERAEQHRRVAEWIESFGRPEDHAEMLAHHYSSALELARAAGQDVGVLATRAKTVLREAGDRAATLFALPQAEHYYREALALLSPDDPERPELLFSYGRILSLHHDAGETELEAAKEAFLRNGDRDRAAEADLVLAEIFWNRGNRERLRTHLAAARTLVAGSTPSRTQARVLSGASRYAMLADRNEDAIDLGRQALELADELGLDDVRAHALNNIGSTRAHSGDRAGVVDIEESVAIASRLHLISDLLRGMNNLATMNLVYGDLEQARAGEAEVRRLGEHFGHNAFVRFIAGGPEIANAYMDGRWEEALERADAFLGEVEAGSPNYQAAAAYSFRGLVHAGRGDGVSAERDAHRALELAREVADPQLLLTVLPVAGVIFLSLGEEREAEEKLREALAELRQLSHIGFAVTEAHTLAWLAVMLGREAEVVEIFSRQAIDTPWLHAGRAVAERDFRGAADIFRELGAPAYEAFFRLRSAEQLVAEARRAEADEQLLIALAFYRSAGATRYIREGEALLAATA